ncbi:hypothetical protein DKT68_13850 [Micromonospora acroterricola]|uniref:PPM-type phosphatase domain-containing protein n=1 Tax=Micromonospora acroterricola TaxID=2202421 RepID=A0A317D4I5_9ACTN|nr:hypothetical protein DKT68_13850 [Micromonospora acroterricola]
MGWTMALGGSLSAERPALGRTPADVVGQGVAASATMGQLRGLLRERHAATADVAAAMSALNAAATETRGGGRPPSAWCCSTRTAGQWSTAPLVIHRRWWCPPWVLPGTCRRPARD